MDLSLTTDQENLRKVFASAFRSKNGAHEARAAEPLGFDISTWKRLIQTGAPGMGVNAKLGGGGALLADLIVIIEEMGAAISPIPLIEHIVATRLIANFDLPEELIAGSKIITLALKPPKDGIALTCPNGAISNYVVALDDDRLLITSDDPPMAALPNHACLPLAHRKILHGTILTRGAEAQTAYNYALDEWRILTASALVGMARKALELGVNYAKERQQFGRPIGSFQAIQHLLADLPGLIDGARLLTSKAAWAGDRDGAGTIDLDNNNISDFSVLATMALVQSGESAGVATDRSLHVHGGYGFSSEYDIQLYYRRARALPLLLADPSRECRRLAELLMTPGPMS